MSVATVYSSWSRLRLADAPRSAIEAAKRHLLDGFGCATAAARDQAVPYATALVDRIDEATVIGGGERSSVPRAALANGILVHALDFDDTHADALVHATAAVLPTAFAVGEGTGATGADVLAAALVGYEVVIRLGAAVTHGFHARGFHATSVCGVFASALVAARLLGLDAAKTVNTLGIAGSTAAGSLEFLETGSSTKVLHPGLAAMNGIVAARLAAAGAEGPSTIFEGRYGLFRSYLGVEADFDALTDGMGTRWEVERITIKPYPCCQLAHASLDALRAAGAIDPKTVERVTFRVPLRVASIVCGKPQPRSSYEAKFSLEHCAAALLTDGDLTVASFDEAAIARARPLAARVTWIDESFEGAPADAPGICEVLLRDGTVLRGEVAKSRGGPDAPMTTDEVTAKALANGVTPVQIDRLLNFERLSSMREVFA